jgi:hypothetical protein
MSCYLNHLSIDDYASEAFGFDSSAPSGYRQGGIYAGDVAGPGASRDMANLHQYRDPNDRPVAAKARFVNIAPGKLFVRWVDVRFRGEGWERAASGAWWSSDNMAEQIMRATIARFGKHGCSSMLAREYSNVGYTWEGKDKSREFGPKGEYQSSMTWVVACRTTVPIKVLIGIGRPVINIRPAGRGQFKLQEMASDSLQVVMLTTWKGQFRGKEFLERAFFGSTVEFTRWWQQYEPVQSRRAR